MNILCEKSSRKRYVVILSILSLFLTLCSEQEQSGLRKKVLDNYFTSFNPEYNYADKETDLLAHAALVHTTGSKTWQAYSGITDSLGSAEINENSVFRIASATKMFTSVLILQLWEEGMIDLDAPFNQYLGLDTVNFSSVRLFDEVTIRHLLSHRSGIPRISSTTFFDHFFYTDSITQMARMTYLFNDSYPEFDPGSQYAYRNSNFNILGLVIERVSGDQYHEVLREKITIPLGLTNTHVLDYDIRNDDVRMAHGYTQTFDGIHYHGSQAWAAGGLVSTVKDLAAFMQSLTSGEIFENQTTFDLMVTPVAGGHYGLGIFIRLTDEGLTYGHSGAIFGYNTRFEFFPELDATIISTMSFNGYDFMVVNWYDDFCFPVVEEIRHVLFP